MILDSLPRKIYTKNPTPIEEAPRLSAKLGGPSIYFKRDDMTGLAEGGNKTRKLEFLIGEAVKNGADTVITAGGIQSNHCRLTLAACIKENLNCRLILEENEKVQFDTDKTGNYLLYHLMDKDAVKMVPKGTDMSSELAKAAEETKRNGKKPYTIPVGGSNPLGATGYAACAGEINRQSEDLNVHFDYIVCVSGSGGMQAGLLAGLSVKNDDTRILGMNVSRGKKEQEETVFQLAQKTAQFIEAQPVIREAVTCFDNYVGPGYAIPTDGMAEAVKLTARTEAVLLDPVYTGKAMAGLINRVKQNAFSKSDNVLFIHSGGAPALYAYAPVFYEQGEEKS